MTFLITVDILFANGSLLSWAGFIRWFDVILSILLFIESTMSLSKKDGKAMKPFSDQSIICSFTFTGKVLNLAWFGASCFELPTSNHACDFLSGKSLLESEVNNGL